jgi:hypothetical protein
LQTRSLTVGASSYVVPLCLTMSSSDDAATLVSIGHDLVQSFVSVTVETFIICELPYSFSRRLYILMLIASYLLRSRPQDCTALVVSTFLPIICGMKS